MSWPVGSSVLLSREAAPDSTPALGITALFLLSVPLAFLSPFAAEAL